MLQGCYNTCAAVCHTWYLCVSNSCTPGLVNLHGLSVRRSVPRYLLCVRVCACVLAAEYAGLVCNRPKPFVCLSVRRVGASVCVSVRFDLYPPLIGVRVCVCRSACVCRCVCVCVSGCGAPSLPGSQHTSLLGTFVDRCLKLIGVTTSWRVVSCGVV